MSLVVWYLQWSWLHGEEDTHRSASQRAMTYADSGVNAALQRLKMPQPIPDFTTYSTSAAFTEGRYDYTLTYDTTTPSLVDTWSTGYYYLPKGTQQDPLNGAPAQRAVIHAKVLAGSITQFLVAVPGRLRVGPGMIALGGAVYARDLVFVKGPAAAYTHLSLAIYSRTAQDDTGNANPSPSYIIFDSTPAAAQMLPYPAHFPRPGLALRNYYRTKTGQPLVELTDGTDLSGPLPRAGDPPNPVYYCDGVVDLARNGPLLINAPVMLYVTGDVHIHDMIIHQGNGWLSVLCEKNIHITTDAKDPITLQATFLVSGAFVGDGSARLPGQLQLMGTLIAGGGVDLAHIWTVRRYYWMNQSASDLPFFTEILQYDIVEGKFQ